MITRTLLWSGWFSAVLLAQEVPPAVQVVEPPAALKLDGQERVISRSKQFQLTGGSGQDRGVGASLAEEAKAEFLQLTEEPDQWKIPVSVAFHGAPGDAVPPRTLALKILFNEAGYNLRLDAHLSRGIDPEPFKYAITSALIYERSLRELPARESDEPFVVPPWLVGGLREASAWKLNQSDRRLYEALFRTGGLFKLDEIFSLHEREFEELDAAMRAAFRVSSGALVMALLQQPQGKEGFRAFLGEVAAFQGETPALLRKHFPELNLSETSLSKWWALQLANIGAKNLLSDVLSLNQTEVALVDALRLNFPNAEGRMEQKELAAWPELAALSPAERAKAVQLAQDSVVRLSYRCFPSYRPILAEYQLLLKSISSNSTAELPARLAALDERRAVMKAKALRARDYLDWFEITRARETSGAFDDYIRLKERLKANPHRRSDNLSQYLDRLDAIFLRAEPKGPAGSPKLPNFELPE